MSEFQQRVRQEYDELKDKHDKLLAFIHGNTTFKALPLDEQRRLWRQLAYMGLYLNVLVERMEAFN